MNSYNSNMLEEKPKCSDGGPENEGSETTSTPFSGRLFGQQTKQQGEVTTSSQFKKQSQTGGVFGQNTLKSTGTSGSGSGIWVGKDSFGKPAPTSCFALYDNSNSMKTSNGFDSFSIKPMIPTTRCHLQPNNPFSKHSSQKGGISRATKPYGEHDDNFGRAIERNEMCFVNTEDTPTFSDLACQQDNQAVATLATAPSTLTNDMDNVEIKEQPQLGNKPSIGTLFTFKAEPQSRHSNPFAKLASSHSGTLGDTDTSINFGTTSSFGELFGQKTRQQNKADDLKKSSVFDTTSSNPEGVGAFCFGSCPADENNLAMFGKPAVFRQTLKRPEICGRADVNVDVYGSAIEQGRNCFINTVDTPTFSGIHQQNIQGLETLNRASSAAVNDTNNDETLEMSKMETEDVIIEAKDTLTIKRSTQQSSEDRSE